MKKILTIALCLAMIFALAIPVMAAPLGITANKATIVIDGVKDDAYADNALAINAVKDGSEDTTTTGKVWTAWDEGHLYFYIEVYDKTPNSACDTDEGHFRDSVEVYLDWNSGQGGDREGSPETPYYQVRIQAAPGDGVVDQITGFILDDEDWGGFGDWSLRGGEDAVKRFAGPLDGDYKNGYVAEMAVPVPKDYPVTLTEGKKIPFDTQINDNMEGDGRTEMIYINKDANNGNQWQCPSDVGALLILGAAYVAPAAPAADEPAPAVGGGGDENPHPAPAAAAPAPAPISAPLTGDSAVMLFAIALTVLAGAYITARRIIRNRI